MTAWLIDVLRKWYNRRTYKNGAKISRFIRPDIRRDLVVLDNSHLEDGVIYAKVRTVDCLAVSKGFFREPEYDDPEFMVVDEIWKWEH